MRGGSAVRFVRFAVRSVWTDRLLVAFLVLALGACAERTPDERLAAARAYHSKGELNAAMLELKSALQENPDHGESRLYLGMLYSESGDYSGAEKELSRALELGIAPARALPPLAKALVLKGEPKRVLAEISPEATGDPEATAGILAARGLAHLMMREVVEARAAFDKAIELGPNNVDARLGRARLLALEGRADEGLEEVAVALTASPRAAEAHMLKGDLLRAAGRPEEARAAYLTVIEQHPGHAAALLALVSLAVASGNLDEATERLGALRAAAPGNPMASYFQALIHFRKGEFKAAREAIQGVLKVAPNHLPSLLVGGAVEFALGAHELAQTRLRYVLEQAPGNAYARRLLAASYVRSGQAHKAMELLEPVLREGTTDAALYALAGEVQMQLNDYEKAKKYFEQASALDPKNPAMRTGLALSRLAAGDLEAATSDLQSASELDSAKHHADVLLIATHLQARQYPQALKAAESLRAKQPNNPLTYNLLAAAHIGNKNPAAARLALEKALELQPGYTPAAMNLAQLDLQEGNKAAARKRFEDIIAKDRSNVQAYVALASLGPRIDATPGEIQGWLETARRESPGSIQPLVMLARLHMQANEPKKALELMENALVNAPNNPEVLDLAGQVQLATGDTNRALATFSRWVVQRPSALAHYRMATAQVANEDYPAAIKSLQRALELRPQFTEAEVLLATAQLKAGRPAESLKIAAALQERASQSPIGWQLEGDIRMVGKDYSQAAKAYETAYSIAPSPQGLIKLHEALAGAQRHSEGESRIREWLRSHATDHAVRMYLAEQYMKSGRCKQAIDEYETLRAQDVESIVVLNNLAWCYLQVRDPRAVETAELALKLEPHNPAVLDTLGWILLQSNAIPRGMELLERAAKLAPRAPDIQYHYAVALHKAAEKDKARDRLEQLLNTFPQFSDRAAATQLLQELRAEMAQSRSR